MERKDMAVLNEVFGATDFKLERGGVDEVLTNYCWHRVYSFRSPWFKRRKPEYHITFFPPFKGEWKIEWRCPRVDFCHFFLTVISHDYLSNEPVCDRWKNDGIVWITEERFRNLWRLMRDIYAHLAPVFEFLEYTVYVGAAHWWDEVIDIYTVYRDFRVVRGADPPGTHIRVSGPDGCHHIELSSRDDDLLVEQLKTLVVWKGPTKESKRWIGC